tara:strand:- start:39 stop:332 length:294 start_codon:yes stop_codon:yes gene_type:complete
MVFTDLLSQEVQAVQAYIIELKEENDKLKQDKLSLQNIIIRMEDTLEDYTSLKNDNEFLTLQNKYLNQSCFKRYLDLYKFYFFDTLTYPFKMIQQML